MKQLLALREALVGNNRSKIVEGYGDKRNSQRVFTKPEQFEEMLMMEVWLGIVLGVKMMMRVQEVLC